jgi:hypothetical protein
MKMTEASKEVQDGWLAGLLDGEGSIIVSFGRDGDLQMRALIANTNVELLETVREVMDCGSVDIASNRWMCTTRNVEKLLDRVEPYLIVKRTRAALARALFTTIKPGTNQSDNSPEHLARVLLRKKLLELWESTVKVHRTKIA